jgi:poly(A) polymerase
MKEDKSIICEVIIKAVGDAADELGYDAYMVGGYVRDKIMKRESEDIDFVCVGGETPDVRAGIAVANRAAEKLGVGKVEEFKNFGTAHFVYDGVEAEFVGARRESYSRGSRKPVVENGTLEDDLNRRDLTINAIAYCVNGNKRGYIDKFDGKDDIKHGIIRTPLDPNITFSDDPLRMLRAIRFAVKFGFNIEYRTLKGIEKNARRISIISAERISAELNKILMSDQPSRGIKLLNSTGLLKLILPSVAALDRVETKNGVSHKNNFFHTLGVLSYVCSHGASLNVRWAALLHDIGKTKTQKFENGTWTFRYHEVEGAKMVARIFHQLKMPLDDMKHVQKLVELHMRPQAIVEEVTDSAIRRLMFDAGDDLEDLMLLCMGDVTSKNDEKVKKIRAGFEHLKEKFIDLEERDHIRNFQPPVNGDEIMEMLHLEPGRMVGIVKENIKNAILDGELENDHDKVAAYIMQKYTSTNTIREDSEKKEPVNSVCVQKNPLSMEEKCSTVKRYIEERMNELWEKIPDAHDVENDNITTKDAIVLGRFMELEQLENFIEKL